MTSSRESIVQYAFTVKTRGFDGLLTCMIHTNGVCMIYRGTPVTESQKVKSFILEASLPDLDCTYHEGKKYSHQEAEKILKQYIGVVNKEMHAASQAYIEKITSRTFSKVYRTEITQSKSLRSKMKKSRIEK